MESGFYTERRSYHDVKTSDNQTAALLTHTFVSPLPYVGSTLSGLSEYPLAADNVASLDTRFPHSYTSWNFHNRGVLTSFFTREGAAAPSPSEPQAEEQTIIVDGALEQILRQDVCLSTTDRLALLNKTMFLTNKGQLLDQMPLRCRVRSSNYSNDEALRIANLIGAAPEPVSDPPTASTSETSTTSSVPEEPAERSKVDRVPARSVSVSFVSFQANGPTEPPYSNIANQMAALTSTPEKQATQPFLATARTPLARDLPSLQSMRRFVAGHNSSHIDTAPALRGLLYAFPQCGDAFDFERINNHFLRDEDLAHRPTRAFVTWDWPAEQRWPVTAIAVTLPAFTNLIEHGDTHLGQLWPAAAMDQTWVAVPVAAGMSDKPWFLEYLLCYLDTRVWAGRLSYHTRTVHVGNGDVRRNTYFTGIPHAHNVSVPGVSGLMLVFLDENITSRNRHAPGLRPEGMNIYAGSPYVEDDFQVENFQIDLTNTMHDLIHDFENSARRMCNALEFIQTNLSCDMAFQLAFSLASDISSALPESPTLAVNPRPRHRYMDALSGAWTIGVKNYSGDNPRHTSSDINAGALANRSNRYTALVNGYNWASVTPMLQYSHSMAKVVHAAVVDNEQIVGYSSHWENPEMTVSRPQYKCHCAGSVFRIMCAVGLIDTNDYRYGLRTAAGLQSMMVMQAAALSLATSLYLTNNDISRWMWANHQPGGEVAVASMLAKIRALTYNHIMSPSSADLFASVCRTGFTVAQDIRAYYGLVIDRAHWALSIPVPYFSALQWASKFGITTFTAVKGQFGNVSGDYDTTYVEITTQSRTALPWYASTGNSFRRLPRNLAMFPHAEDVYLPISVDNWAVQTIGRNGHPAEPNGFVSNILCVSLQYHYRDVNKCGSILVLGQQLGMEKFASHLWGVCDAEYPDPPNLRFLCGAVNSAGHGAQKESSTSETTQRQPQDPAQASQMDPPPLVVEGQPAPDYSPVYQSRL